ncbi:hypothetical protein BaRGS_00032604, partial [Batillaria attramentaria]
GHDEYGSRIILPSARPLFSTPVFGLDHALDIQFTEDWLQLKERYSSQYDNVTHILRVMADEQRWAAWMSHSLALDLSLPLKRHPPDSITHQVLYLAEDQPPFFWTISRTTDEADVRAYTLEMAKHLTSSVANFSGCDILVLPCASFGVPDSIEALQTELNAEIQKHLDNSHLFYHGPTQLSPETYHELKRAVTVMASTSHVPHFLTGEQEYLTLFDPDWRDVLLVFTEKKNYDYGCKLTFSSEAEFQATAAILEAARRLSFLDEVAVITSNRNTKKCV